MIEKAASDKKCVKYDRNFRIEVFMTHAKNYKMEEKTFVINKKRKKNHNKLER